MGDENNVKKEDTNRYPCPACGGNMVFDPETQALRCPYCNNKIDIDKIKENIKEYDFEHAEETSSSDWGNQKRVIHCESCGAETVLDENSAAEFCPFCGSSYIVKNDNTPGIVPESLIPFKIPQLNAKELFKKWIGKRFFAPNSLKNSYQDQKLTGVYIPHWTYDTSTFSTYNGEAGEHYYVTETRWVTDDDGHSHAETIEVQKTRWYPVSGVYNDFFDDILVNASKNINENLIHALEPFNLGGLVLYNPQFLSGFLAEKYSIGLKEGWDKAKVIADNSIYTGVVNQIHADEVRNINISTSYSDIKFKHILLPVWMSSYKYKDKVYRFLINGQTGEVQGESPVSPWKVAFIILLIAAAVGLFIWINSNNK